MSLWQRIIERVAPLAGEDVSNLDRLDGVARRPPAPTAGMVSQLPPAATQPPPTGSGPPPGSAVTYPDPPRG
jgi:hypothetical protein